MRRCISDFGFRTGSNLEQAPNKGKIVRDFFSLKLVVWPTKFSNLFSSGYFDMLPSKKGELFGSTLAPIRDYIFSPHCIAEVRSKN
jgi:hypothetical protein